MDICTNPFKKKLPLPFIHFYDNFLLSVFMIIFFHQFLHKNVKKRLGCVAEHGGEEAIKHHAFFRTINWKDLEARKIKPPFVPKVVRDPSFSDKNPLQLGFCPSHCDSICKGRS